MLNYRYNSIHFVAVGSRKKNAGGEYSGQEDCFSARKWLPSGPDGRSSGTKCKKTPNWNFHLSLFCDIMLFWHLSTPGAQLRGGRGGYKIGIRKEDYPK